MVHINEKNHLRPLKIHKMDMQNISSWLLFCKKEEEQGQNFISKI